MIVSEGTPEEYTLLSCPLLPALPVEIYDGLGPMHLTEVLASGEHENYHLQWVRIVPLGLKLWVKDKTTDETVRTVIFTEKALLRAMADAALADLAGRQAAL